jgi:putative transposase
MCHEKMSSMARQTPQRKRGKHYHLSGEFHELTFSCYRRLPLLTNDPWRRWLAEA